MGNGPSVAQSPHSPLWLRIGFWICIVIAVAVVLRRLSALASPAQSGPPQMLGLDHAFAAHTGLTLAHIVPALLFVLIAPVIAFYRGRRPAWLSWLFYGLGVVVGTTALAMSVYSIGGWTERFAVFFFDALFLYSLGRAWLFRREHNMFAARRWELRSMAVLLGIATTRPVVGVFFATSKLTHLVPQQFFGIAFWIGFSINVLLFELWIRSADRRLAASGSERVAASQMRSAS